MTTTKMTDEECLAEIEELRAAVLALVAEHPDYVCKRRADRPDRVGPICNYNPDDANPLGCLFGAAARAIGWDTADWDNPGASTGGGIATVLRRRWEGRGWDPYGLTLRPTLRLVNLRTAAFKAVQQRQDSGQERWADCVKGWVDR